VITQGKQKAVIHVLDWRTESSRQRNLAADIELYFWTGNG
jgi:hypothetical protein